jgi:hypothetical protein
MSAPCAAHMDARGVLAYPLASAQRQPGHYGHAERNTLSYTMDTQSLLMPQLTPAALGGGRALWACRHLPGHYGRIESAHASASTPAAVSRALWA